jgi:hypothetical protein
LLGLGAASVPNALAADDRGTAQSAKAMARLPSSLRGLHVFHYGTRKSPLDELGVHPPRIPHWSAEFTLTPQQPAVVTGNQNVWPPGSLSAFGASQWYSQGYAGWWTGQITLSDPSANLWLLLLAKAGKTYLIDESVSAYSTGQFTITGPDGTTTPFAVVAGPNVPCSSPQHLKVLYQPEQDGPANFEAQFAPSGAPSSGVFCSVTVSILQ